MCTCYKTDILQDIRHLLGVSANLFQNSSPLKGILAYSAAKVIFLKATKSISLERVEPKRNIIKSTALSRAVQRSALLLYSVPERSDRSLIRQNPYSHLLVSLETWLKLLLSLYRKQDLFKSNYCRLHKSERKVYVSFLDTKLFPVGKIITRGDKQCFIWLQTVFFTSPHNFLGSLSLAVIHIPDGEKDPVLIINTLPICAGEGSAFIQQQL